MLAVLLATFTRHLRLGALAVAIALVGAGGATATVVSVSDSSDLPPVVAATSQVDDDVEDADEPDDDTGGPDDDSADSAPGTDVSVVSKDAAESVPAAPVFDQLMCDAARNHGAYVSSVAQATRGMPDRAALLSAAAHSDCGKSDKVSKKAEKKAAHALKKADRRAAKAVQRQARSEAKAAKATGAKAAKATGAKAAKPAKVKPTKVKG